MFRYALGVAERWRASGLSVDLIEFMPLNGEPAGYVLSAASTTTMMVLRCQLWAHRRWFRRRTIWSMNVAVRHRDPQAGAEDVAWLPAREVGVLAAFGQEQLWAEVEAWIAGRLRPHANLDEALRDLR